MVSLSICVQAWERLGRGEEISHSWNVHRCALSQHVIFAEMSDRKPIRPFSGQTVEETVFNLDQPSQKIILKEMNGKYSERWQKVGMSKVDAGRFPT